MDDPIIDLLYFDVFRLELSLKSYQGLSISVYALCCFSFQLRDISGQLLATLLQSR